MIQPTNPMNKEKNPFYNKETHYDKKYDILYITFGPYAYAESEYVKDSIYIRREIGTERIVGFIIEDYSKKNRQFLTKLHPLINEEDLPKILKNIQ